MFFVRFTPTFPVLQRPTFVYRDCLQPLLLNAIASGSLYLGQANAVAQVSTSLTTSVPNGQQMLTR